MINNEDDWGITDLFHWVYSCTLDSTGLVVGVAFLFTGSLFLPLFRASPPSLITRLIELSANPLRVRMHYCIWSAVGSELDEQHSIGGDSKPVTIIIKINFATSATRK